MPKYISNDRFSCMMMITCWILCMPCSAGAAAATPCDLAAGWVTLNAAMAHSARTGYSTNRMRRRTCLPLTLSGRGSTLSRDRRPGRRFYLPAGKSFREAAGPPRPRALLTLASGPHYGTRGAQPALLRPGGPVRRLPLHAHAADLSTARGRAPGGRGHALAAVLATAWW